MAQTRAFAKYQPMQFVLEGPADVTK